MLFEFCHIQTSKQNSKQEKRKNLAITKKNIDGLFNCISILKIIHSDTMNL